MPQDSQLKSSRQNHIDLRSGPTLVTLARAHFALGKGCNEITKAVALHGDMLPEQCASQLRFSRQDSFYDTSMFAK